MASVLYGLAGKLVGELCSPLFQQYVAQPWALGTKDEFEKLKDTMFSIEAVLLDAEDRQETSNQIQHWLRKIKLVLHDVEDLLQEVTTEGLKRQAKTKKRKRTNKVPLPLSIPNTCNFRLEMGGKVKLIRERLDAISLDSKMFNFTERQSDVSALRSKRREETHSFVPVEKFIGRENDKKYVTELLVESNAEENVSVVSVVGMGGLGKTALAQSVYNSEEVKRIFDLRMWVCVSDPFDVKHICENIIMSATHNRCEGLPMDLVKDNLKSSIDGRKYLLVLDDVWNDKHNEWEKLEVLLTGGARGSKILITARAELVARASNSTATHVLNGLSHEDSWELFKQVAFKRGVEHVSHEIVRIGKEVVEKCFGVPLVVKAIASMLALREKEIDWLDFIKNDLPRAAQDSEGTVFPTLKLSYDYLPSRLKRCFVYCAIYPKDYGIGKKELIGMWMAQGLIQLDGTTRSLEDVGERYFKDLLDRSFFEVHGKDTYKMHDLIHDLAQSLGGDDYYNHGSGADSMVISTRHAWVSGDKLTNICHDGKKLRTLVVTKSCDEHQVNELISTFEQLRVLRLADVSLRREPQFVGGLRHLSYLDLAGNKFAFLPESICSLYNLQTLILSKCRNLKELPVGTRDLVSLRLLDISDCDDLRYMPRGLEELASLQTLSTFVTGGSREDDKRNCAEVCELKSLVNLRGSLEIKKLRASKCVKCKSNNNSILDQLKLIQQLKLRWKCREEDEEGQLLMFERLKPHPNLEKLTIQLYDGMKFPSWLDRVNIRISLPNIVYIKLEFCRRLQHLPPLGLLPSLQQLHLSSMDSVEFLIDSSNCTEEHDQLLFPSLKNLTLDNMSGLTRVVEPTESFRITTNNRYFPALEKLEIHSFPLFLADGRKEDEKQFVSLLHVRLTCVYTETLPSWVQYLPHLQTLKLRECPEIVSLPEWMGNLTSLQELHLEYLKSLASIPDCVQRLTTLQRLRIEGCPKLESRCKKETGADWHKIAHIPNITMIEWDW